MGTPAVADDRDASLVLGREGLGPPLDSAQGLVRARDVGDEVGTAGPVAEAAEPQAHRRQAVVPGEESREQQDRTTVATRDPVPTEGRADQQASGIELPAQLAEMGPPPSRLGGGRRCRVITVATSITPRPAEAVVLGTQRPAQI